MRIIRFTNKGWRERFNDGFDERNVARVASAFGYIWANAYPGATILVGYDTRYNMRRLADVAGSVLAGHGLNVVVSNEPCPTPALGWSCAQDPQAAGAVILTASSASCEYGGISCRSADGGPIPDEFYDAAARMLDNDDEPPRGEVSHADFVGPYLQHLLTLVDTSVIEKAEPKVVVDALYGSSRRILSRLLRAAGCRVREVHDDAAPDFGGLHPAPREPWVDTCEHAVRAYGYEAGLVLDGDADRFGLIDENGVFVTPHRVVPLLMEHLVRNRQASGRIVDTFSSSAYLRRQAYRLGCELTTVPRGFTRIYNEFADGDVLLGAEEFGGVALPFHMVERDGLLVALLMVEYLATSDATVSQMVAELEHNLGTLHYINKDIHLDAASIQSFRNILPGLNPAEVCGKKPVQVVHSDGLVLRFGDDSWVQLRPSRTEPLVRAVAEATTAAQALALAEGACEVGLHSLPR